MSKQGHFAPGRELGMSLEEIAARLGLSKQTVHKYEQRALAKLRVLAEERGIMFVDVRED